MYMKKPEEEFDWVKLTPAFMLCIIIAVAGVLIPGIIPNSVLNLAYLALP
jgi:NADH-quinone oxidoreductase subunit N